MKSITGKTFTTHLHQPSKSPLLTQGAAEPNGCDRTNLAGLQAVNIILKSIGAGRTNPMLQVKRFNNILEQDHRFIKRITRPMMGFKAFHLAAATIAGIETAHMISKG